MVTKTQMMRTIELAEEGWVAVSSPYSENTPIGGMQLMINDVKDICWALSDGTDVIMTKTEQYDFVAQKKESR